MKILLIYTEVVSCDDAPKTRYYVTDDATVNSFNYTYIGSVRPDEENEEQLNEDQMEELALDHENNMVMLEEWTEKHQFTVSFPYSQQPFDKVITCGELPKEYQ
ncbi:MAG TPA: hypothetical protein VL854_11910 [Nitrososphaeraceae archaeon]|nr:hypothetical protein [Nitrososphaeraceae archaeon]